MLKYKDKYYFIYSGHQIDVSYANSVLVSDSPNGLFQWQSYNPFQFLLS